MLALAILQCVVALASALVQPRGPAPRRAGLALRRASPATGPATGPGINPARNVVGGDLECCCADVRGTGTGTGFFRDGHCSTGPSDAGRHTVCITATAEFLAFSKAVGNDLSTPFPEYRFPGLMPGDKWCLCAARWEQARLAGAAPPVVLQATHEKTLEHSALELLKAYASDLGPALRAEEDLDSLRDQAMKIAGL
ncbi:hypothetical protein M885DRAFT_550733 [Pelagophyceae sp. CCMP2097]|nr:hypothetical protein M885DRAFT_550733 [Pelagophyceae sp. CCMP2097]